MGSQKRWVGRGCVVCWARCADLLHSTHGQPLPASRTCSHCRVHPAHALHLPSPATSASQHALPAGRTCSTAAFILYTPSTFSTAMYSPWLSLKMSAVAVVVGLGGAGEAGSERRLGSAGGGCDSLKMSAAGGGGAVWVRRAARRGRAALHSPRDSWKTPAEEAAAAGHAAAVDAQGRRTYRLAALPLPRD